jgi:SAM-dependent methyltransferase
MTDLRQDTAQHNEHTAPVEAWDAIAALYDEHVAPGESELATAGLRLAGLQAGDTFLDIAAGTGGLSLPAARLGAKVLATDWSPKMIEHFNARVAAEGLDAEGRVMDCHALDLPNDAYDVTGSLFGVMLVPDQAQALRETVRVTKPGGHVLVVAYGSPSEFEALHVFIAAAQAVVPEFEGPAEDEPLLEIPGLRPRRPATAADRRRSEGRHGRHEPPRADSRADRTAAVGLDHRRQPDPGHAYRRSHRRATSRHHPGARRDGPRALRRRRPGRADRAAEHRRRYEVDHCSAEVGTRLVADVDGGDLAEVVMVETWQR